MDQTYTDCLLAVPVAGGSAYIDPHEVRYVCPGKRENKSTGVTEDVSVICLEDEAFFVLADPAIVAAAVARCTGRVIVPLKPHA